MTDFQNSLSRFSEATNNELFDDDDGFKEWMVEAVETHESIDDFKSARAGWNEKGTFQGDGEIAGLPFITWTRVQAMKGQTRRDVSVVDFGDRRIVIDADLTAF